MCPVCKTGGHSQRDPNLVYSVLGCEESLMSPHLAKRNHCASLLPVSALGLKGGETRGEQLYLTKCHPKAYSLRHFCVLIPLAIS